MGDSVWLATVDGQGELAGIGRARKVVRATVRDGAIDQWQETEVKWDEAHDTENEGLHHSRIAKFLLARPSEGLLAAGAGPEMRRMLERAGIRLTISGGDARAAVVNAAAPAPKARAP